MKFPNQARLLKKILVNQNMSNDDLAEKLGVSAAYVSNMVNGKAGIPPERAGRLPILFAYILQAAENDFRAAWSEKAKKGLPKVKSNGKPPKHEKTKSPKKEAKR